MTIKADIKADIAVEAQIGALTEQELDAVSGGKVTVHDIVIVKTVDTSTPMLLPAAPAGK